MSTDSETPTPSLLDDLRLALDVAGAASLLALSLFDLEVPRWQKSDGTVVTEADHAVERLVRERLGVARPGDAVLGEEGGAAGTGDRRWIVDPIDGTRNFVARRADWGVNLALEVGGEVKVGVVTRPVLDLCWWAASGSGSFRSGLKDPVDPTRLSVSGPRVLSKCRVTSWCVEPGRFDERLRGLDGWVEPVDLDGILAVVEGKLEALVEESPARIWDRAPFIVLVEEAGGRFRDLQGGRNADLDGGIFTNGTIDADLDKLFAG